MKPRFLRSETHLVDPSLIGRELASPLRRTVAFAVDLGLLWLPSLAAIVCVAALSLRLSDPAGWRALRALLAERWQQGATAESPLGQVAPLLVRIEAPGTPRAVYDAVAAGDLARAAGVLKDRELVFAINLVDHGGDHRPGAILVDPRRFIPAAFRALVTYGVAAAYFALLTAFGGRTLGKRLVGIRVLRVDGHRLDLAESVERFVGYLHIPGSLFVSLLDFWRDPNRRLPHDRVVNTVVVRERRRPSRRR